jgi:hypothetical protein
LKKIRHVWTQKIQKGRILCGNIIPFFKNISPIFQFFEKHSPTFGPKTIKRDIMWQYSSFFGKLLSIFLIAKHSPDLDPKTLKREFHVAIFSFFLKNIANFIFLILKIIRHIWAKKHL